MVCTRDRNQHARRTNQKTTPFNNAIIVVGVAGLVNQDVVELAEEVAHWSRMLVEEQHQSSYMPRSQAGAAVENPWRMQLAN